MVVIELMNPSYPRGNVVEQSTHKLMIKGSNPATGSSKEKIGKTYENFMIEFALLGPVIYQTN